MVKPLKKRQIKNPPTYGAMKPNALFPDETTAVVRAVRFMQPVACARCGKMRRRHWTMLVPFHAIDMQKLAPLEEIDPASGPLFPPLTAVCGDHPIAPEGLVMQQMAEGLRYFFELTCRRRLAGRTAEQKAKA